VAAGAFCLFLIEPWSPNPLPPLAAAPRSGPFVWSFQSLLLGGYCTLTAFAGSAPSTAGTIHAAVAGVAILALWLPSHEPSHFSDAPALDLLVSLARLIGIPYLLLASASPLLQYWHAALGAGRSAYRLYAWSNLACIAALLFYPLVIEPWFGLRAAFTACVWPPPLRPEPALPPGACATKRTCRRPPNHHRPARQEHHYGAGSFSAWPPSSPSPTTSAARWPFRSFGRCRCCSTLVRHRLCPRLCPENTRCWHGGISLLCSAIWYSPTTFFTPACCCWPVNSALLYCHLTLAAAGRRRGS
jgi:hypothetical protein